ncbi:MAG: DUF1405 domain-containing protein [Candidatus Nanohaloarchaea archaeon]
MLGLAGKLRKIIDHRLIELSIVIVNLAGTFFGFYYYRQQFAQVSPLLWIFVADSPVATLALAASLYLIKSDLENGFLDAYAFLANFKYGLWTVFVLLFYHGVFMEASSPPMYLFLVLSHLGMFIQSLLVLEYSDFTPYLVLAPAALLLNDLLDYTLDIHSYLHGAEMNHPSAAAIAAFSLTVLSAAVLFRNAD